MSRQPASKADVITALRAVRLWSGASDALIEQLAATAQVVEVPRGAALAAEGDPADRLGVVMTGKVRIFQLSADGRRMTFETAGPGEPFAAVAALAGSRYPAHVEAAVHTTIAWMPRTAIFDLIEQEPAVARNMVVSLARRVVDFTSMVTSLSMEVPARLAAYLFQRSLHAGSATKGGLLVDLGMTKAELASALGTVPETLSRALGRLRDDGVIEVRSRNVLVKDVGALARLGSGYDEG